MSSLEFYGDQVERRSRPARSQVLKVVKERLIFTSGGLSREASRHCLVPSPRAFTWLVPATGGPRSVSGGTSVSHCRPLVLACLILVVMGCVAAATPPVTPAARTITGTVAYAGSAQGAHKIIVMARGTAGSEASKAPLYSVALQQPGPYVLSDIADDTYLVFAFIDLNDNTYVEPGEPVGHFQTGAYGWASDPVVMSGGASVARVDITILDQPAPPAESPAPTVS
jgi:hypothetical protein